MLTDLERRVVRERERGREGADQEEGGVKGNKRDEMRYQAI